MSMKKLVGFWRAVCSRLFKLANAQNGGGGGARENNSTVNREKPRTSKVALDTESTMFLREIFTHQFLIYTALRSFLYQCGQFYLKKEKTLNLPEKQLQLVL